MKHRKKKSNYAKCYIMKSKLDFHFALFTKLLAQNKHFLKIFFKNLPWYKKSASLDRLTGRHKSHTFYRTPLVKLQKNPAKYLNKFKSNYNQSKFKKNCKHPSVRQNSKWNQVNQPLLQLMLKFVSFVSHFRVKKQYFIMSILYKSLHNPLSHSWCELLNVINGKKTPIYTQNNSYFS